MDAEDISYAPKRKIFSRRRKVILGLVGGIATYLCGTNGCVVNNLSSERRMVELSDYVPVWRFNLTSKMAGVSLINNRTTNYFMFNWGRKTSSGKTNEIIYGRSKISLDGNEKAWNEEITKEVIEF